MSRTKKQYRSDSEEVYERFKSENPDLDIGRGLWRKILLITNRTFGDYILDTGQCVSFPCGFGGIEVLKKKSKPYKYNKKGEKVSTLPIDWVETKKRGKLIRYLNSHTNGYKGFFMFDYTMSRLPLRKIWKFYACRDMSRKLGRYLKQEDGDYQYMYREKYK